MVNEKKKKKGSTVTCIDLLIQYVWMWGSLAFCKIEHVTVHSL